MSAPLDDGNLDPALVRVVTAGSAHAVTGVFATGAETGVLASFGYVWQDEPPGTVHLLLSRSALTSTLAGLIAAGHTAFGRAAMIESMADLLGVPPELRPPADDLELS